jgi:hypothetical protein
MCVACICLFPDPGIATTANVKHTGSTNSAIQLAAHATTDAPVHMQWRGSAAQGGSPCSNWAETKSARHTRSLSGPRQAKATNNKCQPLPLWQAMTGPPTSGNQQQVPPLLLARPPHLQKLPLGRPGHPFPSLLPSQQELCQSQQHLCQRQSTPATPLLQTLPTTHSTHREFPYSLRTTGQSTHRWDHGTPLLQHGHGGGTAFQARAKAKGVQGNFPSHTQPILRCHLP